MCEGFSNIANARQVQKGHTKETTFGRQHWQSTRIADSGAIFRAGVREDGDGGRMGA